jgi:hypothetical protein
MNNVRSDDEDKFTEEFFGLPPMFGPIENGKRTWISIENVDYDLIGYLLSCHLIIEHYMDAFLKARYDDLAWDAAKPTFGQRAALLANWRLGQPISPIQQIKHLNNLRNRLGHQLDYRLTDEDMLPFVYYLNKVSPNIDPAFSWKAKGPKIILARFTSMVAVAFAGSVGYVDGEKSIKTECGSTNMPNRVSN